MHRTDIREGADYRTHRGFRLHVDHRTYQNVDYRVVSAPQGSRLYVGKEGRADVDEFAQFVAKRVDE
jgi:hypothetical protein